MEILNLLTGHPNIAGLKASYEDKYNVHFVIEYCKGRLVSLLDARTQSPSSICCTLSQRALLLGGCSWVC